MPTRDTLAIPRLAPGADLMAACWPPERYRGMAEGFPRWVSLREPGPPARGELLTGAIDWLTGQVAWLDPARWEQFLAPRPFPASTVLEVLTLCRSLHRGGHQHQARALIEATVAAAQQIVRRPEFLAGLYRADALFTYRVWLLALLDALGSSAGGELREVVQGVLDAGCGALTNPGRPVTALLELAYVLELGGYHHPLPALPELAERSILATGISPLYLTDNECYALTHLVFYLSDFADRPAGVPLARAAEGVITLLGACLAKDDLDLSAELLLCALAMGQREHDLVIHGWRRLSTAPRPDGAVPGPLHDPAVLARLSGARAAAYLFGTCYHTTVAAALAAVEWERGR